MDSLFFHPKLVHVPMALGVLMPVVAGALLLGWWRRWLPARAWTLAVLLQGVLVGAGVAALRTGEVEEDRVERIVPERYIEAHEEAAESFVWASGGVLGLMLLALALSARRGAMTAATAATLGTFAVAGLGYRTGHAGGELVYRHGAAQAYVQADARDEGRTTGASHDQVRRRD